MPFYVHKSSSNFCYAFILLCPTTKPLTTYYISITMYLATIYQIWCSYHSYVRKVIRVKILWHHNGPFGSSSSHYSCLVKGAQPILNCPTCYPCLFRMLGFDYSCTSLFFPTRWSPYYSWCSETCKDWYFIPSRSHYMIHV